MFRDILIALVLAPVIVIGGSKWLEARNAYDPNKVCAEQTQTTEESCLVQVHFAQSAAGW